VYGYHFGKPLFCSAHRETGSKNTRFIEQPLDKCNGQQQPPSKTCASCEVACLPRFKGFCKRCYVEKYPADPLSLQTVYKSKDDIIQKFIDSKFDGFVHKHGLSEIHINGVVLTIVYDDARKDIKESSENIVIRFETNKYANGKNPLLYTRLPDLEREITKQFERVIQIKETYGFL